MFPLNATDILQENRRSALEAAQDAAATFELILQDQVRSRLDLPLCRSQPSFQFLRRCRPLNIPLGCWSPHFHISTREVSGVYKEVRKTDMEEAISRTSPAHMVMR